MTLPALRLINNTLFIDNSRLELFTTCPRKGEYGIVRARVPAGTNPAFFLGEIEHLCQKFRYLYFPLDKIDPVCTYLQFQLIDMCYKDVVLPLDEYRTADYAKCVIAAYNRWYNKPEDFQILATEGKALVERSFAVPLGKIGDINIVWIGRIDLGVQLLADGRIFVMDHKTSKIGGDYFATEFFLSSQMQGYTLSLQKVIERPVSGVIINAMFCRQPTRTGKNITFNRYRITYDQENLLEWQDNMLRIADDFINCSKREYFPMHTHQCITKYGSCQYIDTCRMAPSSRLTWLYSGAFKDDEWSPMHEDRINLEEIMKLPLPANYREIVERFSPDAPPDNDPADIVNQILSQTNVSV